MEEFCSHRILPRSFFNCFPRPLQKIFLCSGLLLICIKTFHLQNNSINTAFRSAVMSLQTILDKKCHDICTTFFLKGCLFPGFGNAMTPPSLHYHLSLRPTPKQVAKLEGWGQERERQRQVTFQSLTPAPIQPWSMEDIIQMDFNIVLGTKGRVLVTTSALKSYTLKLEMATSIFINSLVHESRYIPNFRIDH